MRDYEDNKTLLNRYLVNHDLEAYDLLMKNNLKLVRYIIPRVVYSNESYEEKQDSWLGVGCIGLSKAIKTFDLNRIDEITFSSYAASCIRNEILATIKAEKQLYEYISFDELTYDNKGELFKLEEILLDPDDITTDYAQRDLDEYKKKRISGVLKLLNERERKIIEMYFGFNGQPRLSQPQIAKKLNVSHTLISQIYNSAITKIALELEDFKDFYSKNSKYIKGEVEKEKNSETFSRDQNQIIANCDKKVLEEILSTFSNKVYIILSSYYGLNDYKQLSVNKISELVDLSPKTIIRYVREYTLIIKKMLEEPDYEYKKNSKIAFIEDLYQKYGKENVDDILAKFDSKDRELFENYYGLNGKKRMSFRDLSLKFEINIKYVTTIVNHMRKMLLKELMERNRKIQDRLEELYQIYGRENVMETLKSATKRTKVIVSLYYGINMQKSSKKEISMTFNTTIEEIDAILDSVKSKLSDNLKDRELLNPNNRKELLSIRQRKFKLLFERFSNININKSIEQLDEKERCLLSGYYGIDGETVYSLDELSNMFSIDPENIQDILEEIIARVDANASFLTFQTAKKK